MAAKFLILSGCAALALAVLPAGPALAQTGAATEEATDVGEIIVTARRRAETAQETPVALTVLNDALLERYGVKGVAQIQSLTPGLITGESSGAMGGTITLRGIGSGDSMAFIDTAVSSNVDGVPISSAQILRAAQLDLKQIEVLRGPQALFFGKNSPGGIISLTTAEPGNRLEAMVRGGYEFTAREKYVEAMISAPLSDSAGVRVAGRYSSMKGYIRVFSPPVAGQLPMDIARFPKQDELFLRGAISLRPSDRLSIRLKATYTDTDMIGGSSQFSDIVACPYGVPQRPNEDAGNCLNDGVIWLTKQPANVMGLSRYLENPNGNRNNSQFLLSGTIDYDLTDELKLTSVTGWYTIRERLTSNGGYGPISNNLFGVLFENDQFTQELRLASDFNGPLNFLVGGFYEHRKLYTLTSIVVPQFLLRLPTESTNQKQNTYSLFGQLLFDPSEQVQITLGGRYSHETKDLLDFTVETFNTTTNAWNTPIDVTKQATYPGNPIPRLTFNNFSPEATITWKPSSDLMVFASYKRGYKSGGFDAGFTNGAILTAARQAQGQTFGQERVEGGEIGLKSSFAGRQATFNLTGYWYDYKGLQVSVFDTIARAFRLLNAANARVRGIEAEFRYRPDAVPGLNLHATLAYNDAKFRDFLSDCYAGQTVALGCNQQFVPSVNQAAPPAGASTVNGLVGLYSAQNLSGRRLRRAPEFTATAGGYYETTLGSGLMASLSADLSYSSSYDYGSNYQPIAFQPAFAKLDATFRLFTENKRWELAVIGRNLTDRRNLINGIDRTGTGGSKGNNLPSCTAAGQTGCSALADLIGTPTMPRTVAVQLSWRY
jgi:iron complex outermembrane recepter protein